LLVALNRKMSAIDDLKSVAFLNRQSSIVNRQSLVLLVLFVGTAPAAWAQNCTCSGFNSTRTAPNPEWSFTSGSHFARARANLSDPAFFGASGVVNQVVTVFPGTGTATPATLASVNIFFTGSTQASAYTPAERADILAAVRAGMNLVATSDDPGSDISDLFGVVFNGSGGEMNTTALPDHPILAGPFGRITQFRGASQSGYFRGWPSGTLVLASSSAGPSMLLIPRGSLSPSAGAVLLLADVDMLTTAERDLSTNTSEPSLPVTDALFMNLVAFLCNPSAGPSAPHLVFPQIADGEGNFSSLLLTNTSISNVTSINVSFRDDNGAPFPVPFVFQGSAAAFVIGNMEPNQTMTFNSPGRGLLRSGTALIRGSSLLTGNILFLVPGLGITGIASSEVAGGFDLPIVPGVLPGTGGTLSTGLAVSNLTNKPADIRLELWDSSGRRSDGIRNTTVPANGHFARFLYQLYSGLDLSGFQGTLRIVSRNTLLAVTALQLGNSPGQFSALTVKPLFR
jgi:hypothetical protein